MCSCSGAESGQRKERKGKTGCELHMNQSRTDPRFLLKSVSYAGVTSIKVDGNLALMCDVGANQQ